MRGFFFLLLLVAAVAAGFYVNANHKKVLRDWDTEMSKCNAEVLVPFEQMIKATESLGKNKNAGNMLPTERIALLEKSGRPVERLIETGNKAIELYENKPGWFGTKGGDLNEVEEKDLKLLKNAVALLAELKRNAPKFGSAQPMPFEVTMIEPVQIRLGAGTAVLPVGSKVRVIGREGANLRIQYLGNSTTVPVKSTSLGR